MRVVLPLIVVALDLYALLDLAGSNEEDRGGLPRWLWAVIIVLLPIFGALAWIVMRRAAHRSGGGGTGRNGRPGRGPKRPSGPVAPDDDPDFLWKLEQDRRRRERDKGGSGEGTSSDPPR
ncbi:PLD nuclease N-terminal domain-containing protein [Isoptericola sp. NEAU-Y5]|uniref:PLD nuclease N-terminal domain-containing protein n=1 Tax=Isoptericola luteus TaxID=2879484 RepID=A0ABS7ZJ12_9MICO|nr:PLD nuclease N-terminal domain-containing protein [Isoptericola sp. NEAU-Y5]MCA5895023.1 PLD nuclease N-terminal domain-containing protein [Isoptericola sp. NEAU-Y5]